MIVQPCFTLTSFLYNICISVCKLSSRRLWQTLHLREAASVRRAAAAGGLFTHRRLGLIFNVILYLTCLAAQRSLAWKKKAKDPWFKLLVCISAILNWKWESEQEDMNPERQRDVRVRDVDVNRQSDEPVVFVWNASRTGSVSSGQTLRFDSKQTQLFFCFFFYPLAPKLKKQNHRGGEVDRNLRCRGLRFGRFADPCRRLSDCFVSNWFL